jgi:hypothetical protein
MTLSLVRFKTAELYVFSGQMDFAVATLADNGITWHVKLDE